MLNSVTEQGLNWLYAWCYEFPNHKDSYDCCFCELVENCINFNNIKSGN